LLSLIVFPIFLFLLIFSNELFAVVFKHKYDASVEVFLISIFIILIRINNYSSILQYYQKGNKIITGSILDICIAVILIIILYPLLGTRGAALAIVIATYCQVFYYLWQTAKVLSTSVLSFVPLKILAKNLLIMLLLYTCLHYSLYTATDSLRLLAATIATIIFITFGLFLYFSKKRLTRYGLITKV
jgi:O-antigen/teichoic acid export membrane protein